MQISKRLGRTILLSLSLVLVCSAVAYAYTTHYFYAAMEWPDYISGYSTLSVGPSDATAQAVTTTVEEELWYDPLRAHVQLWEDGHFRNSKNKSVVTYGSWTEIKTALCYATESYSGNWWVYGVHQAYDGVNWNDITSDGNASYSSFSGGYASSTESGDVDLAAWNDLSMTIAESSSGESAVLIPWSQLAEGKAMLGSEVGHDFLATILDGVVPYLEDGDLLPTVSVDKATATATVYIPKENGNCSVIKLELPKTQ